MRSVTEHYLKIAHTWFPVARWDCSKEEKRDFRSGYFPLTSFDKGVPGSPNFIIPTYFKKCWSRWCLTFFPMGRIYFLTSTTSWLMLLLTNSVYTNQTDLRETHEGGTSAVYKLCVSSFSYRSLPIRLRKL